MHNILLLQWPFVLYLIKRSNLLQSHFKQSSGVHHQVCCLHCQTPLEAFFPEPLRTQARASSRLKARIHCFLSFCSRLHPEVTGGTTGNSLDMQAKSERSAAGVVSCTTSSAMLLISRDRGGCRTGARHGSGSAGWAGRLACAEYIGIYLSVRAFFVHVSTCREETREWHISLDSFHTP